MPHSSTHIYVHLVFATKKRCALIDEDFRVEVERYLSAVYANGQQTLLQQYAMPDHYHGLFRVNVRKPIDDFVKVLKSASTHFINKKFANGGFAWQNGYGIFSHTAGDLSNVINYI